DKKNLQVLKTVCEKLLGGPVKLFEVDFVDNLKNSSISSKNTGSDKSHEEAPEPPAPTGSLPVDKKVTKNSPLDKEITTNSGRGIRQQLQENGQVSLILKEFDGKISDIKKIHRDDEG
ncbi:hypothetical protein ACFL35_21545, partial [Candidatus Riflebacteria bacterium]